MSLPQSSSYQVPETTARVAQAIFPTGDLYMRLLDRLGIVYEEKQFADLFSSTGQPAKSLVRLVLVSILQFVEGLTDRQAADAVRTRIDFRIGTGGSWFSPQRVE